MPETRRRTWITKPNTICPIAKCANKKKRSTRTDMLGKHLSSLHPAWYVVVGVILIGISMLVWISLR